MIRALLPLSLFLACCAWFPSPVLATEQVPTTATHDCTKKGYREVKPGVYIQTFDSTEVSGGIAGLPDRLVTNLAPGEGNRYCIGFHNRTGKPLRLSFSTEDVGASSDGVPTTAAESSKYGAASWITLPTRSIVLQHGELVWLDVAVAVPADTSGGSNYAAILAGAAPISEQAQTGGARAEVRRGIAVQMFFDVQGDVSSGGELVDVESPRVVWWDGLGAGDLPVLKQLRGLGIAPIRFDWKNTGSFTDRIGGDVRITSSLGGKQVAKLPYSEQVVLRSSTRDFDVTWSKDIPFIGRFTPTIHVTTADGRSIDQELDPIWVIPAWWYIALLVLAIAIPVWLRRRSNRRYAALLARVEDAEARGDDDLDDDEWSHS